VYAVVRDSFSERALPRSKFQRADGDVLWHASVSLQVLYRRIVRARSTMSSPRSVDDNSQLGNIRITVMSYDIHR
jgi:hypothetical protein